MPYRIEEFEHLEPADRERLLAADIRTTGELIQACSTPEGRIEMALRTGLDPERLLRLVHLADLMRIDGVGRQYAELLGESGVETVEVLRTASPGELAEAVREVNREKRLSKTTPSTETIGRWVWDARDMTPRVFL